MKYIGLFLYLLIFNSVNASVFRFNLSGKSQTIEIIKLENLHVSKNCYNSDKQCMTIIKNIVQSSMKNSIKQTNPFYGHPASQFCQKIEGKSTIVYDEENNQYDLCLIGNKYYIDSWDLFNNFKK